MYTFLPFLFIILYHAQQVRGTFNCDEIQYSFINETRRSTAFENLRPYKCDRGVIKDDHWYRFYSPSGNTMPTQNPGTRRCGTYVPIWFRGEHPTNESVVVNATACAAIPFVFPTGCGASYNIKVVKCSGDFYLYQLKEPKECSLAYCAGTMLPPECSHHPGTDIPLCPDAIPVVDNITASPSNDGRENVRLNCSWVYKGNASHVKFKVRWIGDEHAIERRIGRDFDGNEPREYFYHFQWSDDNGNFLDDSNGPTSHGFEFDKEVYCEIQVSYKDQGASWSGWKKSNRLYTGISVYPTIIRLNECGEGRHINVTLRPYLPVNERSFNIEIQPEDNTLVNKICIRGHVNEDTKRCETQLTTDHSFSTPMFITLLASCQQFVNANNATEEVDFMFTNRLSDGNNNRFWRSYQFPRIKVYLDTSKDKKTCSSVTDPHFTTFDGLSYDFMGIGTFRLYRNNATRTEVQTRQKSCGWRNSGSCNCGVAIKEGFFYQIFDMCRAGELFKGNKPWWENPAKLIMKSRKMANSLKDGFGTTSTPVGTSEMHYKTTLPSGVVITVKRRRYGLSTYVKAPRPRDDKKHSVEGLCGNFNGNEGDEYGGKTLDEYTMLNRVRDRDRDNIFKYKGDDISEDNIHSGCLEKELCICYADGSSSCDINVLSSCFPDIVKNDNGGENQVVSKELCGIQSATGKRALASRDDTIDDQDDIPSFEPPERTIVTLEWPTPSNLTEAEVTNICNKKIRHSKAGQNCGTVTGVKIDIMVKNCISDIKATDNIEWATDNFGAMEFTCKSNILTNITYYKNGTDGKLEVETEILEYLCPNDCSDHGNCSNSTCTCDDDYTAPDCSISLKDSPLVFGIRKSGLCDVRRRPCRNVGIYAFPLLASKNLTCYLQEYKVIESVWTPSKATMLYPGKQVDLTEVQCFLPESPVNLGDYGNEGVTAAGLKIAVSNNRINVSKDSMLFITYDTVCQECNTSTGCRRKNDSCLISGHCFAQNESHPNDWCRQCLPGISTTSWGERKDNQRPMFTTSKVFYAYRGKQLRVQLNALDPEGRTIRYSFAQDETFGASLNKNGLFIWTKDINNFTVFKFNVTDECGAYSVLNVSVVIKECPCQNLGECFPDYRYLDGGGNFMCSCPAHYTGNLCQFDVNECAMSKHCFNGSCYNEQPGFYCSCFAGYTGDLCQTEVVECSSNPCFPGVSCTDMIASFHCGPCPIGYSGNGENCTRENQSPQFTTPSVVYAIMNTDFEIRIEAGDPEGKDIVYILMSNGTLTSAQITKQGLLTVSHVKENGTVYIRVEDKMGAWNILILHVKAMQCPCKNHGKCYRKPNVPYPVQPSHYFCQCEEPHAGHLCEIRPNPCDEQPCYPGLKCSSAPNSEGFSCEDCPPLFEGDGKHCKLNGTKDIGKNSVQAKMTLTNEKWDDQLTVKTSKVYKKLVSRVTIEIRKIYISIPEFSYFIIKGFSRGSIVVDFELIFSNKVDDPLEPLLKVAKTGKLGNMTFEINEESDAGDDDGNTLDTTILIVIIVAAVVLLILIIIFGVCRRIRRHRVHREENLRRKRESSMKDSKPLGISYQETADGAAGEEMDLKVFDNEAVRLDEDTNLEP